MLIGIIAEYNPFHNGHAYQLSYLREKYRPEGIVVAMSGNFVQRGEPAAFDKYVRADAALRGGADIVFELPQIYAVSSASAFAAAGVGLLAASGCDVIACGAENPDYPFIDKIACILADEPAPFKAILRENLKNAMTYPAARAAAIDALMPDSGATEFLSCPNNLLALEYYTAAKKYAPDIKLLMHQRKIANHDDRLATAGFASSSYLRNLLRLCIDSDKRDKLLDEFYGLIPESVASLYHPSDYLQWNDFSAVLYDRLSDFAENPPDDALSRRIANSLFEYSGAWQFIDTIKTKNITYTSCSRALVRILLGYEESATDENNSVLYFRLLGMKKEASKLLSSISSRIKSSGMEILTSLPQEPPPLLKQHIKNDMLYEGIRALKTGTKIQNEYRRKFLSVE